MPVNLAYRTYRLFWEVIDWLYPPNCGGCGKFGVRFCTDCSQTIREITPPICQTCGDHSPYGNKCVKCQTSPPKFTWLRSSTAFEGSVREAIHRLKYQHEMGLGEALARLMITSLEKLNWSLDIVTCVPLGLVRLKERGYNQATLLARPIALYFNLPYSSQVLSRTRETKSQVGLTVRERQDNMNGAFQARRDIAQGKMILVIDDVATSGATINACAKALLDAGAKTVYGFSLARAVSSPEGVIDIT